MFRDCVGKCTENICSVVEFKCAHVHIHDSLIKYFAKFVDYAHSQVLLKTNICYKLPGLIIYILSKCTKQRIMIRLN